MSAAALFTPGSGSFHTPHSERLNDLPPAQRVAASETWHAIVSLLRRGKAETDERVTDRVLAQFMGRSRRFVQKGLRALQDLGMIARRRMFGRRIITVIERLRGRSRPQTQAQTQAGPGPAPAKVSSIPNVGTVAAASPGQVAAARARIDALDAGPPEPTPEEIAATELVLEESRRRRRARLRPAPVVAPRPVAPGTPGITAQLLLEARRHDLGIRIVPDPDPGDGSPPRPAGP